VPWRLAVESDDEVWVFAGKDCSRLSNGSWSFSTTAPIESRNSSHFSCIEQEDGRTKLVVVSLTGNVYVWEKGVWESIPISAPSVGLSAIAIVDGKYLLGSRKGLLELDLETGESVVWDLDLPSSNLIGMTYDPLADVLWMLGLENWIVQVRDVRTGVRKLSPIYEVPEEARPVPLDLLEEKRVDSRWARIWDYPCSADLTGGLYFGSRFCVAYFNPLIGFERIGEWNGLNASSMSSAKRDHEGNTWICGVRGANKITSQRIRGYSRNEGLYASEVTAALQRRDGTVVLGHAGGISLFDDGAIETIHLSSHRVLTRVMDLAEDSEGQLWFAAGTHGLGRLRPDGSVVLEKDAPIESVISVVAPGNGEGLWVASDTSLVRYLEGRWSEIDFSPDLGALQIRKLHLASNGSLYIATGQHGVLCLADGELRQWASRDPRSTINSVFTVLADSSERLWAGTKHGLARLHDDGQLVPVELDFLRPIYALIEDQRGRLWMGSDIGIHCWNGSQLESLGMADGVIGEEANRSAAMITDDGKVWFGSNRGISVVDDRFLLEDTVGPRVELESLEAGGTKYDLHEDQVIDHGNRTLTFRFRAFSFIAEDRVEFQAFLQGWDTTWSPPATNPAREFRFSLPPGEYQFFLKAIDVRGEVSDEVSSAMIRVQEPVWKRPWFRVLIGSLFVVILSGGVLLRMQRRYAARLQLEVAAQTRDIREMEREQEKLLRLESLALLAGGIAHDFNNLLTTIMGNASLLAGDSSVPASAQDAVHDIEAATKKATALTSRLLTFSRGGAPIKESTDIGNLVRECTRFCLRGSNVQAEISIQDDLQPVAVDTGQFSQVLHNLVINARQAMSGGGTLYISVFNDDDTSETSRVVTEVRDEGPGIAPEDVSYIFDPYFTTKVDGHGLGLATARSIIERHGGTLTAVPSPSGGATFRIAVPVSAVPTLPPKVDAEHDLVQETLLQSHVLVMDDQETVRKIARSILERSGCTVVEAADGSEAVELYEEALGTDQPIDVVLMDLTVPGGMGGVEAAREILNIDAGAHLIATSGYAEEGVLACYEEYGFVGRLRKPFSVKDARNIIAETVQLKRNR